VNYVADKLDQMAATERAKMIEWMNTPLYMDDEPRPPSWVGDIASSRPGYKFLGLGRTTGPGESFQYPRFQFIAGPGEGRGWHDSDVLPVPMLMPDLCPSLKGSGLTLADVTQAIYEVHEILKKVGPDYDGEDVRRAMILNRLEARLHEARAVGAS